MPFKNQNTATTEALDAVKELQPLVKDTRLVIADLAVRGTRAINELSSDRHYPIDTPIGLFHSDSRFFRARRIVDHVSPKINANRSVDGMPGLEVVGATTEYTDRRHYFRSLAAYGEVPHISLPGSRSADTVSIDITNDPEPYPNGSYKVGLSPRISTNGYAGNMHMVNALAPRSRDWHEGYQTAEEVRDNYFSVYSESLAIAGLVSHGLRAYDINLKSDVTSLFNEWRNEQGQHPAQAENDAIWTATQNPDLHRFLPQEG